jgi:hypothetical protein
MLRVQTVAASPGLRMENFNTIACALLAGEEKEKAQSANTAPSMKKTLM